MRLLVQNRTSRERPRCALCMIGYSRAVPNKLQAKLSVDTPQFRTLLLRKLKNLYPDYGYSISTEEDGLSFQLLDSSGNAKGSRGRFYRHNKSNLERVTLVRLTGIEP